MKPSDIKLIAGFVGKMLREQLSVLKGNLDNVISRMNEIESRQVETKQFATAEEIAEQVIKRISPPPSVEDIVAEVMKRIQLPTIKDIASQVVLPTVEVPSVDQIVEQLKQHIPAPIKGDKGDAAEPVTIDYQHIIDQVQKAVAELLPTLIPAPIKGDAGKDAEPIDNKLVLDSMKEFVSRELPRLIPEPIKGDKGDKGDTAESVKLEEVVSELRDAAINSLKELIPAPIKGDKGDDGKSVTVLEVMPLMESEFNKWALAFERRASDVLSLAVSNIEKPKDGSDGFGFDDMTMTYDGRRRFAITFLREGKESKSFDFDLPIVLYEGVYKEGTTYSQGDSVTWGGSTWIAKKQTSEKPNQSDDWQLSVKRGSDGKDFNGNAPTVNPVRVAPRNNDKGNKE